MAKSVIGFSSEKLESKVITHVNQLDGFLENNATVFVSKFLHSMKLFRYIALSIGKCDVVITSYGLDVVTVKSLEVLKRKGKIGKIIFILDYSVVSRSTSAVVKLRLIADEVIQDRIHAKIWLFENSNYHISVDSSINFNSSKMINAGSIFTNKDIYDHYLKNLLN